MLEDSAYVTLIHRYMAKQTIMNHQIDTDGITVWVNSAEGYCIGRFGRGGIDIHRAPDDQRSHGECLHCTHEEVTAADWEIFKFEMRRHYGITVSDRYKPKRFRLAN